MRVIVTGARNWRDVDLIRDRLSKLMPQLPHLPEDIVIVHGAASGADAIAHDCALRFGYTPEPHWPKYAWCESRNEIAEAPKARNQKMVDLGANLCLAFPTKGSRGTWDMVKRAELARIPVEVISNVKDPS